MANQREGISIALEAGHALTSDQYKFVKVIAANTVSTCNGTTDLILGVLQNKPLSGEGAAVRILGHTKVISGADDLAYGDIVSSTTGGGAIAESADVTTGTVGLILSAASSGNVAEMVLFGPSATN